MNRREIETADSKPEEIYACSTEELETFSISTANTFEGACLDTGAQKAVVGRSQANAYCRMLGKGLNMLAEKSPKIFRFGTQAMESLGTLYFRIPVNDDFFVSFMASVVDINVPLLLGLDVMSEYKLVVDIGDSILFSKLQGWMATLTQKLGHIYLTCDQNILYTPTELTRIHRHFFHPHSERLFSLMKRAQDPDATPETHKQLEEITNSCDICQRLAKEPGRFRVALPSEDIVFNRTVYMDLTKIDSTQCLHIVDKDTLFNAAVFLSSGETTDDVWNAYMRSWVIPYIGYSQKIHTDQGPQFMSDRWDSLLRDAGIEKDESGIESHNAIGSGERYHAFLRKIYKKVRAELINVSKDYALSLAVKAMNETAGPNGLSPILLVFGVHPRMPLPTTDLPEQRERMKALKLARSEMVKAIARSRLATAKRSNVPAASDSLIKSGMEVLVYREGPKQWNGPYAVISVDEKQVVLNIDNHNKTFSVDKVKPYLHSTVAREPETSDNVAALPPRTESSDYGAMIDQIIAGDAFFSKLYKSINRSKNEYDFSESIDPIQTYLTEVLKPGDQREFSEAFEEAKQFEVNGLMERGTFETVDSNGLGKDANILGGRFVCTLKNKGTDREKPKARYVAQGHRDKEKPYIVHNITTLRQSSVKIVVSTSAVMNFRIFSHDVTQAYLQSDDELSREIYLRPRKEDLKFFGIQDRQLLRLKRALYGVTDAGDYWGVTFDRHVKQDLQMQPIETDPSLYIKLCNGQFSGLLGSYVDDCLLGGDKEFQNLTEKTLERFDSRPREWDNVEFLGVSIFTHWEEVDGIKHRCFKLGQPEHLSKILKIPLDISFDGFRSVRACFGWLSHSRPDVCCAVNRAAQVTVDTFDKRHIQELNKAILRVRSSLDLFLKYETLDISTLHIRAYVDASFATNEDHSSQLGYVILLCDATDRCHFLDFASKKCKRVVRSIMAGEIYAFAEGFDCAYAIKHTLERIYGQRIPITMLTDSKQMFDVITKASQTTEKRLLIDIAAAREAYNRHEISNVGLVLSGDNVADGLTKVGTFVSLNKVMETGFDRSPVQQWIFRES